MNDDERPVIALRIFDTGTFVPVFHFACSTFRNTASVNRTFGALSFFFLV